MGSSSAGAMQAESGQIFELPLSQSLAKKIADKARDEGISPQELACELLAEGLVLRAWEIMERKSTMRGEPPGGYNKTNRHRDNKRKFNKGGGHNILDDRAAFVEYVRNQEKKRR